MKKNNTSILVIDDSFSNNLLIKDILQEYGYNTLTTDNGYTGIKLVTNNFPDLVLLDIMMPEIDGYVVLKEILKKRKVPVIMLSAISSEKGIEKAMKLGATEYVVKPIIISELLKKIETVIEEKKKNL